MRNPFNLPVTALCFLILRYFAYSPGDELPIFGTCFDACVEEYCDLRDDSSLKPLPFSLRMFRWSCSDNCKYECMIPIYEKMKVNSPETGPVQQFFGKWPFYRVFGIQEFGSVVFSILNGWMHFRGYNSITNLVPKQSIYRNFYLVYAMLSMNLWLWSAVFHSRDTYWTEKLDYFSAYLAVLFSLYFSVLRIFKIKPSPRSLLFSGLTVLFILAYIHHLVVMIKDFDYEYNMKVGIAAGVSHNLLWFAFSLLHYKSNSCHPGRWLPVQASLLISVAILFEVFDFPALFGYLDAHSLWHLSTVFIIPLWYKFFALDSSYLRSKSKAL